MLGITSPAVSLLIVGDNILIDEITSRHILLMKKIKMQSPSEEGLSSLVWDYVPFQALVAADQVDVFADRRETPGRRTGPQLV